MTHEQTMTQVEHQDLVIIGVRDGQCPELWKVVEPLLVTGKVGVVINLAGAVFIESVSIAAIISTRNKVTATGRRFAVANLEPGIQAVFRILKLNRMFSLELNLDQAIANALSEGE